MPGFDVGRVVVTGGAGFIGCALSQVMASRAERWVALDVMSPRVHDAGTRPHGLASEAELVVADVCDPSAWDRIIADVRPNVIVHLAADTDTGLSLTHAARFAQSNVLGTAVMLDSLTRHDHEPDRIVLASTRAVYGEGTWRDIASDAAVPRGQRTHRQLQEGRWDFPGSAPVPSVAGQTFERPTNVYGVTKLAQEGLAAAWTGARNTDLIVLRLQNVYGPGQSLINPYTGILALFTRLAAAGQRIEVYEDGGMLRDFVHVDDVVAAFARVLTSDRTARGTFDIGTGVPTSVLEVARFISELSSAPSPIVTGAFREGDVRHAWCDPATAIAELDWRPEIDWRTGIARYAEWYRALAEEVTGK